MSVAIKRNARRLKVIFDALEWSGRCREITVDQWNLKIGSWLPFKWRRKRLVVAHHVGDDPSSHFCKGRGRQERGHGRFLIVCCLFRYRATVGYSITTVVPCNVCSVKVLLDAFEFQIVRLLPQMPVLLKRRVVHSCVCCHCACGCCHGNGGVCCEHCS